MISMQEFRPASEFAKKHGVKSIVHGPPGSGKTPIFNTAPRPMLISIEPGLMSMRHSTVPTFKADTPKRIDEIFEWLFGSQERYNFDTFGIDSGSEIANTYLEEQLSGSSKAGNKVHGEAAYGEMARKTMGHMRKLYFLERAHTYIICQQGTTPQGKLIPGFPGRALEKDVPHLYDVILALGWFSIPGVQGMQKAFKTFGQNDLLARDRSGMLNEYEPCDLTALFAKVMS